MCELLRQVSELDNILLNVQIAPSMGIQLAYHINAVVVLKRCGALSVLQFIQTRGLWLHHVVRALRIQERHTERVVHRGLVVRELVKLLMIFSDHVSLGVLHWLLFYFYRLPLLNLLGPHFLLHRVEHVLSCGFPQNTFRRWRFSQAVCECVPR